MPAEVVSLAKASGSFFARWLPGFIARWWFNEKRLNDRIKLALRDVTPIALGGSPNQLSVYLRISNFSSADVTIDRLTAEVWFGQPSAIMYYLVPFTLSRNSEVNDICIRTIVSDDIARRALSTTQANFGPGIHVYLTAICKTSFRDFVLTRRFERDAHSVMFAVSQLPPESTGDSVSSI